jgi:hypothetical protein
VPRRHATVLVAGAAGGGGLPLRRNGRGHRHSQIFDVVLSTFGVMFFDDPAAAFGNLRKTLRCGGSPAFLCWRTRDKNPFFTCGFAGAAAVLGRCEMPGPDAALSLADTGRVGALLSGAGFGGIEFATADEPMLIGDDVLEYERAFPSAGEVLTGLSPAQAGELTRHGRDRLVAYASPGGVTMPSAAWLVTAQAVRAAHLPLDRTRRFGLRERCYKDQLICAPVTDRIEGTCSRTYRQCARPNASRTVTFGAWPA